MNQKMELLNNSGKMLEEGTLSNQDWKGYESRTGFPTPAGRFYTLEIAFNYFKRVHGKVVVELGTSRSFSGGEGCNTNEIKYWKPCEPELWDWGAGVFTRLACSSLSDEAGFVMHTVDLSKEHLQRCKYMNGNDFPCLRFHVSSSEDFLNNWNSDLNGKIDLLYLDTGDMTPIEPTALLHQREASILLQKYKSLLSDNAIVLIDDVKNQTPYKISKELSEYGKSKYAIPMFEKSGIFTMVAKEYQWLLKMKQEIKITTVSDEYVIEKRSDVSLFDTLQIQTSVKKLRDMKMIIFNIVDQKDLVQEMVQILDVIGFCNIFLSPRFLVCIK